MQPFIDEDHFVQDLFPPRMVAIAFDMFMGVLLMTMIVTVVGMILICTPPQQTI